MKDKPPATEILQTARKIAEGVMRTYRIKPLEWIEFPRIKRLQCHPYTIRTDYNKVKLKCSLLFVEPMTFETIEAAKAKAQELHEAELAKYLQEVE